MTTANFYQQAGHELEVLWEKIANRPELIKNVTKSGESLTFTLTDGTEIELSLAVFWNSIRNVPKLVTGIVGGEDKLTVQFLDGQSTAIAVATSNSGNGLKVVQKALNNVTANSTITIPVKSRGDYTFPPIEVLKHVAGAANQSETLCSFVATDAGKFTEAPFVSFNNGMYLKTSETFTSTVDPDYTGTGCVTVTTIDKNKIGTIANVTLS